MLKTTLTVVFLVLVSTSSIYGKEMESDDRSDLDTGLVYPVSDDFNVMAGFSDDDVSLQDCSIQIQNALSKCSKYQQPEVITPVKGKRSVGCMQRCVAGGVLHPAQCHSLCK